MRWYFLHVDILYYWYLNRLISFPIGNLRYRYFSLLISVILMSHWKVTETWSFWTTITHVVYNKIITLKKKRKTYDMLYLQGNRANKIAHGYKRNNEKKWRSYVLPHGNYLSIKIKIRYGTHSFSILRTRSRHWENDWNCMLRMIMGKIHKHQKWYHKHVARLLRPKRGYVKKITYGKILGFMISCVKWP